MREDRATRVEHAAGRSYPDLFRLRTGNLEGAPDAVVEPGSAGEVAALLAACAEARIAVVPFGGGSSVVGGVDPVADGFAAVITLDLRRLDRVIAVDRTSLTATLEAGLFGPEAERRLAAEGVTLGHFPQSFEFSTVGGWVATRSAGQASTGHGRIDELVDGLRLVAPAGEVASRAVPATAAGPDLRELVMGSEGTLGVICEATLRVRELPATRALRGLVVPVVRRGLRGAARDGAGGCVAGRGTALGRARDAAVDDARLDGQRHRARRARVPASARATRAAASRSSGSRATRTTWSGGGCTPGALLRAGGGLRLGRRPGEAWLRGRYAGPYVRDALLNHGVFVETLETATTWSNLRDALRAPSATRCARRCPSAARRRW